MVSARPASNVGQHDKERSGARWSVNSLGQMPGFCARWTPGPGHLFQGDRRTTPAGIQFGDQLPPVFDLALMPPSPASIVPSFPQKVSN